MEAHFGESLVIGGRVVFGSTSRVIFGSTSRVVFGSTSRVVFGSTSRVIFLFLEVHLEALQGGEDAYDTYNLQIFCLKRASNFGVLLRKMTYKDKASYDSTHPVHLDVLLKQDSTTNLEKSLRSELAFRCTHRRTAYCIWSVISPISQLNQFSSFLRLFCHVPMEKEDKV